ncbi:MarR family transcriptional regulator, transcriptional regulator for hemolysin [Modestobacter sp. DSM 44400]|uniref:MarR family winged helix-turn-helix transcriptional regulator n=1 Tax=Modestobacter sp. DSM 44400 TaxID=1550230 RepID=UPI000897D415|nr:MarR family winged helix-turn-helix transcriptional regulator [Modestobacter sp. DSM 44400]SDY30153.1 MarR family transcriptional regulator, transcriptional regulator for hemolysin [Modestobacter sp. DSM 44400]
MPAPRDVPLGLLVTRTAKALSRAFDDALVAAGGSTPAWLVLLSLKAGSSRTQAELAAAVGVRQPTLTHHLAGLERAGLVIRTRDPDNRRVQQVALTPAGEGLFRELRVAAGVFDRQLRAGLSEADAAELRRLLGRLADNAGPR